MISPKERVRYAKWLFVSSIVFMVLNDILYLTSVVDEKMLIFVTLNLSWLAITVESLNSIITTDIRANDEDK